MDMQPETPQQPPQGGFFSPEDQQQQAAQGQEGSNGFTINSAEIEKSIVDNMDPKFAPKLDKLIEAGNQLIFGKETHYKLMEGLDQSQDIGGDLGKGALDVMMLLIQESKNMPGEIIIPAGVILIARVYEFLNESGMAQITDDDFEESVHVFVTLIQSKLDPEFQSRMQQQGATGQQPDSMQQQSQPSQPTQPQQQGGGILDRTGV